MLRKHENELSNHHLGASPGRFKRERGQLVLNALLLVDGLVGYRPIIPAASYWNPHDQTDQEAP